MRTLKLPIALCALIALGFAGALMWPVFASDPTEGPEALPSPVTIDDPTISESLDDYFTALDVVRVCDQPERSCPEDGATELRGYRLDKLKRILTDREYTETLTAATTDFAAYAVTTTGSTALIDLEAVHVWTPTDTAEGSTGFADYRRISLARDSGSTWRVTDDVVLPDASLTGEE